MFIRIIILIVSVFSFSLFSPAQTLVSSFRSDDGLWGYMTIDEEVIIPAKYLAAKPFSTKGIALVKDKKTKEYLYIDVKGNKIELNCNPVTLKPFHHDRAIVVIGDNFGAINLSGELVIENIYSKMDHFYDNRSFARDQENNLILLDANGNSIDISQHNSTNYKDFHEGLAAVKIGDSWGYIDVDGNLVIEPQYPGVGNFSAGLAWARVEEEKIGYINKKGEMVIEPVYIKCHNFDEKSGMAKVMTGDDWFYIDKTGGKLLTNADRFFDYSHGYVRADTKDAPGLFGYKDKDGSWIIEPQYETCGDFYNGYARIRVNKKWGVIDKSNQIIIEPKYDRLEDFILIEE